MAHLWSGRFAGDPDAELFTFGSSFRFDRRLFEDDVRGSLAWAGGLARAGVLSPADAAAIARGLQTILDRGLGDPAFVSDAHGDEDVHAFVERELIARIGEAGRRLHTGRSRNEQVAVDLRLYLKRRIPEIQRAIAATIGTFVALADRAGDAMMPSYTHLRRAQPVLVAHFLLSHCAALRRDVDRLTAVLTEVDELPLGSGAIAGTSYPIDVQGLAKALGFGRIAKNSIDVSRHLTGWLGTMKGLPAGYNRDRQEDKEALFDAEDTWLGCLRAVSSVIGGLKSNAAVSARAASGLLLATDVADYLVAKGLPFR